MWSKRRKTPHFVTVQSIVVLPETKLPVGLNAIAAVGAKDAPRIVEIQSSTALLHTAGRAPAADSTHC